MKVTMYLVGTDINVVTYAVAEDLARTVVDSYDKAHVLARKVFNDARIRWSSDGAQTCRWFLAEWSFGEWSYAAGEENENAA